MLRIAKKKVKKFRLDPNPDIAVLNHITLNLVPSISDLNCLSSLKVIRTLKQKYWKIRWGFAPDTNRDITVLSNSPLAFNC